MIGVSDWVCLPRRNAVVWVTRRARGWRDEERTRLSETCYSSLIRTSKFEDGLLKMVTYC